MEDDGIIINGEIKHILPKNNGSSFGKCGVCALVLIEPVFIMYHMIYWAFDPLNDQFVVSYVTDRIHKDIRAGLNSNSSQLVNAHASYYYADRTHVSSDNNQTAVITFHEGVASGLDDYVQQESSRWVLILNFIKDVLAICSTLVICSYTDIAGRKLGVIIPLVGFLICHIVYIVTIYLDLPIQYLIIGSVVDGLSGSSLTVTGVSFAYIAQVASQENISFRYVHVSTLHIT